MHTVHNMRGGHPTSALNHSRSKGSSSDGNRGGRNMDVQTMEKSLLRSVTLVFWHKAKCEPLRLHLEISTFPYFQLSHIQTVMAELSLTSASYVDSYNERTGHWEQCMVDAVRAIEGVRRLLFRIRKSLLEGLSEDDCLGLKDEIAMQPKAKIASAPSSEYAGSEAPASPRDAYDHPRSQKIIAHDGYQGQQHHPVHYSLPVGPAYPQSASPTTKFSHDSHAMVCTPGPPAQQMSKNHSAKRSGHQFHPYNFSPVTQSHLTTHQDSSTPLPVHPHPPLKRWPNDYTVSEIASGFRNMDALIAQTPSMAQRLAFERVFCCRYVKSTVCRHRGVWRRASAALREEFEKLGVHESAVWGEFVRKVEGRPSAKLGPADLDPSGQLRVSQPDLGALEEGRPVARSPLNTSEGSVPINYASIEDQEMAQDIDTVTPV